MKPLEVRYFIFVCILLCYVESVRFLCTYFSELSNVVIKLQYLNLISIQNGGISKLFKVVYFSYKLVTLITGHFGNVFAFIMS